MSGDHCAKCNTQSDELFLTPVRRMSSALLCCDCADDAKENDMAIRLESAERDLETERARLKRIKATLISNEEHTELLEEALAKLQLQHDRESTGGRLAVREVTYVDTLLTCLLCGKAMRRVECPSSCIVCKREVVPSHTVWICDSDHPAIPVVLIYPGAQA